MKDLQDLLVFSAFVELCVFFFFFALALISCTLEALNVDVGYTFLLRLLLLTCSLEGDGRRLALF